MAFHDVRLPDDVEKGAQGGPRFRTSVLILSSGFEKRNIDWQLTRGEWDIGYGIQTKANFNRIIEFFYARQGRAHSFRFKDWTDFEVGEDATDTFQEIGIADGIETQFQIVRRYTSGGINFDRPVTRLVAGTTRVFVNGTEQFAGFTVADSTGIITFSVAPTNLDTIEAICEFDVPVRFETDSLDISAQTFDAGSIPQIPVVEVRGE